MTRGRAAVAAAVAVSVLAAVPGVARAATQRLVLADARPLPLTYFQGQTHDPAGRRWFDGVVTGLFRTDLGLVQQAGVANAIDPAAATAFGFDHIGDITFDPAEGGRIVLPLECFTVGAPYGGNTCGQGAFGVADPATLAWRYLVPLDPVDIPKAMWAEVSPDGALLWTSSGPDLLAYRTADVSAAVAATGVRVRPAVRLAGAVPPSGITGAAFLGDRLLVAGQDAGPLEIWSVDVRTGARRREAVLRVAGESEGLDVVDDGRGLVHWLVTPFDPRGRPPTFGVGHSELLSLVRARDARLRVRARLRGRVLTVRASLRFAGRVHPVPGARVRAGGRRARTGADGVVRVRLRRAPDPGARVHVRVAKRRLRPGTATVVAGAR